MQPTRLLAERIASAGYASLPDPARTVAKQALMDFIGVTLAGVNEPLSRILRDEAREQGGHAQARILGTKERSNTVQAALINGAAGHAHDYDDVHTAMNGHPTVPVAPAVLALGEQLRASGEAVISAFATGVDVECILGRYAGPAHYARGWHNTGTLGTFGAAAASARLLRLDAERTDQALGIAGTRAAGLKSQFGTMCKPLHAGHAAATGLQSAGLAAKGFTSCHDILEAAQGFMETQAESASVDRFEQAMATGSFTQDICFKYHAACYLTHSAIEATRSLSASNRFRPGDITGIDVHVDKGHFRVCNIQEPRTGLEAKFSLRLTTAMALSGLDTASITLFDDALTRDPDLIRFRDLVTVHAHEQSRPETVVRIHTADGQTYEAAVNVAIPMRDLDAQWTKLEAKFLTLTVPVIGDDRAHRAAALLRDLERVDDLTELTDQLAS
ncbi:MAG TPA: MmgE/PrpD family protein [Pseudomonadales bacterium]